MQQGEDKPVVKAPPVYTPTKFLISSLNTFVGNTLVRRLRNDDIHPQNPNRILGTVCQAEPDMSVPDGVRKVIDTQKVKFFEEIVLNSDVIIYDLNTCDLKEAQFAISTLKINNFAQQKTLICISNVMTWAKTKPKQKKQGDEEEGDDNPPQQPDSEVEGENVDGGEEKKPIVRFQDKDYTLRKPDPQYQKIKSVQTLCMTAGKAKPNLKSFVVCSGIIYGEGQRLFAPYFMQARLQKPEALVYYGNGKNRIPMIHIEDLVTYVEKVIQKKPAIPYLLALDHNPKPTQAKMIQQISKGIGTGKVQSVPVDNNEPNIKLLTLNLRMRPTMCFAKMEEEEAAIEREEGDETPKFMFKWICKEGVQKSIKLLCEEFNNNRGLSQTKIFITGPPGSGKSFYAKQLAEKYYLPHIHIKEVIEQVKNLPNELGEGIKNFFNEKKEELVSAKQAEYEELKEKQKKIPKELRDPLEPFDPESVDVRLSDEDVYKCYKWRLNQNDCLNRGYILDGYPKKYEDAVQLFMGLPPPEEDGGQVDENQKKIVQPKLIPNKLIVLEMSDEDILMRLQNLSEEEIAGTHFNEKATKKRLKNYRENTATTGQFVLEDFFKQNGVQIHHVDGTSQTMNVVESIIKPLALDEKEEQMNVQRKIEEKERKRKEIREEMSQKQKIIRDIQNEDYIMKKENEQNEERQILDKTSLALRKYLDVNLVPILSEGIVDILREFPEDPVDKLAAFLFENSLKVPNPDPSTFEF